MRKKKKNVLPLFLSILSLAGLLYLINFFVPNGTILIMNFNLPTIPLFFILFFIFFFSLLSYLFANKQRGFYFALIFTVFLILRASGINNPFFAILLFAILFTLELLLKKRS